MIFHNTCWLLIKSLKASKANINYWFCELEIYGVWYLKQIALEKGVLEADDESNPWQRGVLRDSQIFFTSNGQN